MAAGNGGYRIVITSKARDGLRQIIAYLEENASSKTARYVRHAVLEGLQTLVERPESHGIVREISDEEITFRRVLLLKGKYRIIYTIVQVKTEVRVVDISRTDYLKEVKSRT